jgi:hypothetical protein
LRVGKTNKQKFMKTLKNVLWTLILSVALFSCTSGDVSLDGTLTGTISNYTSGTYDVIKSMDNYSSSAILGSCTPGSNGAFSLKLSIPTLQSISQGSTGLTISDSNAKIGMTQVLIAYKSNSEVGIIVKTDMNVNPESSSTISGTLIIFMYADRACTIKGSISGQGTYDLNLKKGWNEVAGKYQGSSSSVTITTSIPSNLKWKYFPYSTSMGMKKFQIPAIVK